jgi:8-oxo-dGTP diphosphatase
VLPSPIVVVAAVIERDDRFLLTRRLAGTHLAGLWEFPGGKCHASESLHAALERELREELDVDVSIGEQIFQIAHTYPERSVELHFYRCTVQGTPRPLIGQEMRWVPREDLAALEFPPADRELIELLTRRHP